MRFVLFSLLLVSCSAFAVVKDLPNPKLTPGALNTAVTQANIHSTICVAHWTDTIRPGSYTARLKLKQIIQYGYADVVPGHYEEDHLVSLELGGHPTDPKNLWPQPYYTQLNAKRKDQVEDTLRRQVCAGKIKLADAQKQIATDWVKAYHNLGLK
jgi:hypothetical protein